MDDMNGAERYDTSIVSSPDRETCSSCGYKEKYYSKNPYPNFIPTKALKLEEMASVSVAIGLWNHITSFSAESFADYEFRSSLCDRVSELTEKLPIPESFREDIDNYFGKLDLYVGKWVSYHCRVTKEKYPAPYRYIHHVVWHPNGAVNFYETALNLLKSDELTDLEKYRLACKYCLKEEIEKRWPRLLENGQPVEAKFTNNYADSLFCYWNCYCAGKLHLVPVPEDLSIDEYMFLQSDVDNWPAIEYFFDRLLVERRIACAIRFIDGDKYDYQELLLLKLNESQRTEVYARKAVRIIQNYLSMSQLRAIEREVNEQIAISTWYEVRDLITWPQFVGLMNRLVRNKPSVSNDILMEIWASSYDELKLPLLNHANYDFIGDVFRWACEEDSSYKYDDSIKYESDFFFAALEDGAKVACKPLAKWNYVRKKYFKRVCYRMMKIGEVERLTRVINLCTSDAQDNAKIKRILRQTTWRNSNETVISTGCEKLISTYEFPKLVQFVNFFYPDQDDPESREEVRDVLLENLIFVDSYCLNFYMDGEVSKLNEWLAPLISAYPEVILEYKKCLLCSERGIRACYLHFDSTTDVLADIVSDGLPEKDDLVEFRRKFIFSEEGICKLHKLLRDKSFPKAIVKRNIDLFLKSSRSKRKLKEELIRSLRNKESNANKKYVRFLNSFFDF